MLMQILRHHPQVGWIEFEESYIEFDKPKKWVLLMAQNKTPNLKEKAWGEKIPWGNRPSDKNAERAINFSKKWLNYFKSDARILHIIRHPIDVASSGRPDGNPGKDTIKQILNSVPHYIDFINTNSRCATVVYEDLVCNPKKQLQSIFEFCNLSSTDKIIEKIVTGEFKFGKINSDRAFAFEKTRVISTVDYNEILETLKIRL